MRGKLLHSRARARRRGFTLLEQLAALAVCALLVTVGAHAYSEVIARGKIQRCVLDLAEIAMRIEQYRSQHGMQLPDSLAELGEVPQDPWGRDYRYLNFSSDEPGIQGKIRKDHNLHPLNSEFDLYSTGPDGQSAAPLTAAASRDDIIWAHDGSFIGPAKEL